MNMPDMESSNTLARLRAQVDALAAQVRELRAASGTLDSATIYKGGLRILDPATTAQMLLAHGQIQIWDDFNANPDGFGLIYCDAASSANLLRWFPPHDAGTGLENSVTVRGTAPGMPGAFWVYTDGIAQLISAGASYVTAGGNIVLDAGDRIYMDGASSIDLVTPKLRLYEMGDTGAAANLALEVVGGEPILRRSVSSEKYKTDLAPLEVDIDDMLEYQSASWVHISTLDASPPGPIRRNVGHHVEAMDARPSLRQFVNYDEDEKPDSVEGNGFVGALHEAWKHTHGRVVELEERVSTQAAQLVDQASQIAALSARLDALSPIPSADDPQE